jgi:hypothetical protein
MCFHSVKWSVVLQRHFGEGVMHGNGSLSCKESDARSLRGGGVN